MLLFQHLDELGIHILVLEGTATAQRMRKREQVKFISHCKSKVVQSKHELSWK